MEPLPNCPICNSELTESHIADDYYVFDCKSDLERHFSILYFFYPKDNSFKIGNESFRYGNIFIQKIYYTGEKYPQFYWSMRLEKREGPFNYIETLHHIDINHDEFITKFGEFNPTDISLIKERFEIFQTFQ